VGAIIAGGMGPRAQDLFAEKKIETIIGVEGPVDEVIDRFLQGRLEAGQDLCEHGSHDHEPSQHEAPPLPPEMPPIGPGKICVTAKGADLGSELDLHFGRAPYFLLVDPETGAFEAFENPSSGATHGAGIQAAQFVVEMRPAALLTGQVGPNAGRVLDAAGVRVISAAGCTVREALASLKKA